MKKRKGKTIVYIALVSILSVLICLWILNEVAAQVITILSLFVVVTVVLVKTAENPGMSKLLPLVWPYILALCGPFADTAFAQAVGQFYNGLFEFACRQMGISPPVHIGNETALIALFLPISVLTAIVLKRFGRTATGTHSGGDLKLREKDYVKKSADFCTVLRQRLESLNREADWNESQFTPVEAEVEVEVRGKRKKRYADLLRCLKRSRWGANVFLVLGDPGAGKSVCMRKLCLELLGKARRTQKIPVYIDLRKWNKPWSLDKPPRKSDLEAFVKESLREDGDESTGSFLNTYFSQMLETGRWYFVFDSFDEMPCLMGRENCQELIDRISELLFHFLTEGGRSGGVIASRLYRAPSKVDKKIAVLRIQEFSDIKIRQMLRKYLGHAEEAVKALFGKREDLVALCRNPFCLSLLIDFIQERGLELPKDQMELYSSFVEGRLKKCAGRLEEACLSKEKVHDAAKRLAFFFQKAGYGLECPARDLYLYRQGDREYWQKVLKILEYAKICRFGGADETVSFVYRRFQEFFLVESLVERHQAFGEEEYSSILHGGGLRDALVLYCDVAEESKVREIAEYCWRTIQGNIVCRKSILKPAGASLVNVLDFMAEAFRKRKSALSGIIGDFEKLVTECLDEHTDFIILLSLTNSMVLFEQDALQEAVLSVFQLKNRWLNDAVMQNCRSIQHLDRRLETKFSTYLFAMDTRTFFKCFRNMCFSLSISKSFRYIRFVHIGLLLRRLAFITAVALAGAATLLHFDIHELLAGMGVGAPAFSATPPELMMRRLPAGVIALSVLYPPKQTLRRCDPGGTANDPSSDFFVKLLASVVIIVFFSMSALPTVLLWILAIIIVAVHVMMLVHDDSTPREEDIVNTPEKPTPPDQKAVLAVPAGIIAILFLCRIVIKNMLPQLKVSPEVSDAVSYGIIGIAALILAVKRLMHYLQDWWWVTHRPDIRRIDRAQLAEDLAKLHFSKWKCAYAEQLLKNEAKLVNKWPDGQRPGMEDDDLIYLLSKLDCMSLEGYSCTFKV